MSVVLVTGPPRSGVSAMVAELARRLPSYRFVERGDLVERLAAVVFVVSAVTPLAESDCALIDFGRGSDLVIGVVAKIDDHHEWRRVLAVNRESLGGRILWVGAAAAPRLGEPAIEELVGLLETTLGDATARARNALLAKESQAVRLRDERDRLLRGRRQSALERARVLRGAIQQTRLDLMHAARRRCAALRTELLDEAVAVDRSEVAGFPRHVRQRCGDVLADVDEDIAVHAGVDADAAIDPVAVADPPLTSRRLENRLMAVLGAGFGFGVALVVTRLVAGLAPGLAVAGLAAGGGVGLATTVWVIRARALLHLRGVLHTWVADAVAAARSQAEERVATGMLAAESAMASASAAEGLAEEAEIGRQIAAIEAELRQLTRSQEGSSLLPTGRSPGSRHLNRSCE